MIEISRTDAEDALKELYKRVIQSILKPIKLLVPTVTIEDDDGKERRVHKDIPIVDNVLYVGTDRASCISTIEYNYAAMCKRKSTLQPLLEGLSLNASMNYGTMKAWLKLYEASIRTAKIGSDGLQLTAIQGRVEVDCALTPGMRDYADGVKKVILERVQEKWRLVNPTPLPDLGDSPKVVVLGISSEGITVREEVRFEHGNDETQLKLAKGLIPVGDSCVTVYKDIKTDDARIVRITTHADHYVVNQYFRVLHSN